MIQSVKKALDLLDLMIFEDPPGKGLMLGEMANRLGLPVATAHNLLKTLCNCGYAVQLGAGLYGAGPRIMEIGRLNRLFSRTISHSIRERMVKLCGELKEGVVFTTLSNGRRISLWRVQPDSLITVDTTAMENNCPFRVPTGRVLAAFASPAELEQMLSHYGLPEADHWPDATTDAALANALEEIRGKGYEIISGKDICAFAVPLLGADGSIPGALGCFAPAFRCPAEKHGAVISELQKAAQTMSALF